MYRVGGDEFLMIIDDPGHGEAESMIKDAREKLAADAQMYENKKLSKESRKR